MHDMTFQEHLILCDWLRTLCWGSSLGHVLAALYRTTQAGAILPQLYLIVTRYSVDSRSTCGCQRIHADENRRILIRRKLRFYVGCSTDFNGMLRLIFGLALAFFCNHQVTPDNSSRVGGIMPALAKALASGEL